MVDFKKVKAPNNTITRNPAVLADTILKKPIIIFMRLWPLLPKDLIRLPSR